MDVRQLAELVNKMRNAQREYFRTRSASSLEESKRLEKEVDRAISEALSQPTLF